MTKDSYEQLIKEFGVGKRFVLSKFQLESIQRICDNFRKAIMDNCYSHALYRCTLTADEDMVYLNIKGSDIKGNIQDLQVGYDFNTKDIYTRKVEFTNEEKVGREIYSMILKMMEKLPFTVGMLSIPLEGKFLEGSLMGYCYESGTKFIIIQDSLDYSFFLD